MMSDVQGTTAGTAAAVLIAGPTASGKSGIALALAERLGGIVVNADSMQVYADIPILSAQPSVADRARVRHVLFGHVDGATAYSVGQWLGDVEGAMRHARDAGQRPIIVGGTGLYFKALTQGLSTIPAISPAVRAQLRAEAEHASPEELHRRLAVLDPDGAARLRPSDPQRILRALEVVMSTGRPLHTFQQHREPPLLDLTRTAAFFLSPDRAILRASIDARFRAMVEAGALDEVATLAGRGLPATLPVMRALGVAALLGVVRGKASLEAAIAAATKATRAYARRQLTFGRHQLPGFTTVTPEGALDTIAALLAC